MRICIDYSAALHQRAGIGRFTRELVAVLAEIDRQNQYLLIATKGGEERAAWPPNFSIRSLPFNQRMAAIIWHRLNLPLPLDLFTGRLEIFHSPDFVLPPLRSGKTILTVHDLTFLILPQCAEPRLARYLTKVVPKSIERADIVLADSNSTKQDLVNWLGVPEEKIEVIYGGVSPGFAPITDEQRLSLVQKKYGLEGPFIITVGTLEPRKNLRRIIEAYALLKRENDISYPLAIVGRRGWLYRDIFAQVEREGLNQDIRFLDYVPEEDLPTLLSLAAIFVFPSLYEGFGLPPLEAMACGTPVVASNTSSLPEALGSAAILIDPQDTIAWAQGIHRLMEDERLRQELRERGLAQASRFSWSASAQKLLDVYNLVGK